MKDDYYWWDLEGTVFKAVLYDSINTYFLYDHSCSDWNEFSKADPHMAYAHLTYIRFNALEQQFVDLRVIPQMLGVNNLPLVSKVKNINRYDWLKAIIDLALFRFSSLRDITFHFVNEVLELNIPDHSLNIKQFGKIIKDTHADILTNLKILDSSGGPLRTDRNTRAHKGFCNLYTDDDEMFKNMSWIEDYGSRLEGYNLNEIYEKSRDKIYDIVVNEIENALSSCRNIVDELYFYYRDRHEALSIKSRSGVSAHFYNYHGKKE